MVTGVYGLCRDPKERRSSAGWTCPARLRIVLFRKGFVGCGALDRRLGFAFSAVIPKALSRRAAAPAVSAPFVAIGVARTAAVRPRRCRSVRSRRRTQAPERATRCDSGRASAAGATASTTAGSAFGSAARLRAAGAMMSRSATIVASITATPAEDPELFFCGKLSQSGPCAEHADWGAAAGRANRRCGKAMDLRCRT